METVYANRWTSTLVTAMAWQISQASRYKIGAVLPHRRELTTRSRAGYSYNSGHNRELDLLISATRCPSRRSTKVWRRRWWIRWTRSHVALVILPQSGTAPTLNRPRWSLSTMRKVNPPLHLGDPSIMAPPSAAEPQRPDHAQLHCLRTNSSSWRRTILRRSLEIRTTLTCSRAYSIRVRARKRTPTRRNNSPLTTRLVLVLRLMGPSNPWQLSRGLGLKRIQLHLV